MAQAAEKGSGDVPTVEPVYEGGIGAARVFVLSRDGQPLMPCHPARARKLLARGRAVVVRRVPFAIRLKDRTRAKSCVDGVQLRIDPGSHGTGLVLTDEKKESGAHNAVITVRRGLFSVELQHRGDQIRACMQQRAGYRRRRRSANRRYRAPRSWNRTRPIGWLPPSVRHRVDTTTSLANRLTRYAPVTEIHVESVAFDMRRRGPSGGHTRTRLRARWDSACAYCGVAGVRLNVEHVRPRSRGGSDRISNLVLACVPCNQAKGSRTVEDFLAHRPERLATVLQQVLSPLDDAAVMNAVSPRLTEALSVFGRPVHGWSGRLTKKARDLSGLCKTHTMDALSVGYLDHDSGGRIVRVAEQVLVAQATGRGSYARTTPDRYGFPRLHRSRTKQHFGYVTGDLVRAVVTSGMWVGTWTGRVSVRARGQHSVTTPGGRIDVFHERLRPLQRGDGYEYGARAESIPSQKEVDGGATHS
ncbi:RNA-guided endonuclease IscB [Streptomyces sp. NPDC003730]